MREPRDSGSGRDVHQPSGAPSLSYMFPYIPPKVWIRMLWEHKGTQLRHWPQLAQRFLTSILASPLRWAERIQFDQKISTTPLKEAPLTILGLPRSGTTHLHNLLTQDPRHGFVSTFQAIAPECCLTGGEIFQRWVAKNLPPIRPLDNVKIGLEHPQEEEFAIANSSHMSFYHSMWFPRLSTEYFGKYVLMSGLNSQEFEEWRKTYLNIVRKAQYCSNRRRIILKNPLSIFRIRAILRVFPEMKFIHIVRNPFLVYHSLCSAMRRLSFGLEYSDEEIENFGILFYIIGLTSYLQDRRMIPSENLVEVRFEDLIAQPNAVLKRVYMQLDLSNWEQFQDHISQYLESILDYKQNRYKISQSAIDRVNSAWGFAVNEWGYSAPHPGKAHLYHK